MPVAQLLDAEAVVAPEFGSIGQASAIRSNGGGDERVEALACIGLGPKLSACFANQSNGATEQVRGLMMRHPPAGESFEAGLVGGGDDNIGAGLDIIEVDGANQLRLFDQQLGGPQRIAQVGAATFQLGGNYWNSYRTRLHYALLRNQGSTGSWLGGSYESNYGPSYCTAMAVLALTVEYRFLPIYQRGEEANEKEK